MRRRISRTVQCTTLLASAAVPIAACTTVTGTAAAPPLWDTCSISDDTVLAIGADPATEDPGIFGKQAEKWDSCSWRVTWYVAVLTTTNYDVSAYLANPNIVNIRPARIPERNAIMFTYANQDPHEVCDIAFEAKTGTFVVSTMALVATESQEDPCDVSLRNASIMQEELPQ